MFFVGLPLGCIPDDTKVAHPSGGPPWYVVGPHTPDGKVALSPVDAAGNRGPTINVPSTMQMAVAFTTFDEMLTELGRFHFTMGGPPSSTPPVEDDDDVRPDVIVTSTNP